ncbi:alpha-N-acetylglucosaminidase [Phocaeicola plebeius]|jgi:alpha-N-acetylglucosaminidase|uniref:Alpha-N-acetylglucosaminidase n=1 Tax=Phocaeicola plebeius TaxID=310297 RepID=A0A412H9V8_9BACT|nr:alpha-N-acetylglucosaminidase [Phocaeicola plebeius]RGR91385.1 alpha-N-acetylglucosaminidase [Phocaeicola plebeius]RGS10358.1 alpha-N-acetylglucosaminidase [Phocaeicola plebeius]
MKTKQFLLILLACLCFPFAQLWSNPVNGLLERIDSGASKKFIIQVKKGQSDFFELDQKGDKVVIRGNNYVNIATGLNWYLKYYAGIHLSWNGMTAKLPESLPKVSTPVRKETNLSLRYDFNYCTYSYTMAFWDWERWEKEIDWMALHGINLPLAVVGQECVWKNMLEKLGYSKEEINKFIAGPAFLAWWAMNNLEGWGGPNPDSWYTQQEALQKKILKRMREYGIEPVFPGYSGMVPHDANKKLGLNVTEPALWNGFTRPAFLLPTDSRFNEIASLYYKELEKLFGKANYYSMDPFHELEDAGSVDFDAAGKAVLKAMKDVNPKATWVIQGWTENPRPEMIKNLNNGDILILDLFSECRPMWGIPSIWKREKGYEQHDWLFCMIENFGGNVGLHGRMDQLLNNFYLTKNNPLAAHLKGIGLTMEGSENNPVMFELMCELPWRPEKFTKEEWLKDYLFARYGVRDEKITQAWSILADGIYNCPFGNNQQGPHESIFCGRPGLNNFQASSWSKMQNYYDPTSTEAAARLMLEVADKYKGNNNFEYDLVDIVRQSLSDRGRIVYNQTIADFKSFDKKSFAAHSQEFLNILLAQNRLLGTRSEFRVGRWIEQARNLGTTPEEKDLYEWNARVQITTWGNRVCANDGGLRDYAHKEWNGLLKDFYYKRWAAYWQTLQDVLDGKPMVELDYYAMEEPWTLAHNPYASQPEGDCVSVAKEVFNEVFPNK